MKIHVVIPCLRKPEMLEKCLKHMFAGTLVPDEVTVVNLLGDEGNKEVVEKYPEIRLINTETLTPFSETNNTGVKDVDCDYLWLLSNDVFVEKDCLSFLVKKMDEDEKIGLVGTRMVHENGTLQHCGVEFDPATGIPYHGQFYMSDPKQVVAANMDRELMAVTFASVLIRKKTWDEIGGLDEIYKTNYEDADFCLQAKELGYKVWFAHKARAIHVEAASKIEATDVKERHKKYVLDNRNIYMERWLNTDRFLRILDKFLGPNDVLRKVHNVFKVNKGLNLVFVQAGQGTGCNLYRMWLPAGYLSSEGLANTILFDESVPSDAMEGFLKHTHVIVFQSPGSETVTRFIKSDRDRMKVAVEHDDHPVEVNPYNDAYTRLGTDEITWKSDLGEDIWLHRDGYEGFDLKKNRITWENFLEATGSSNMITTTTPILAEEFRKINSNTVALPNCVDFDILKGMEFVRNNGEVRIGWHGGSSHYEDWYTLKGILPPLFEEFPHLKLVLYGQMYGGVLHGIPEDRIEYHPWTHVRAFWYNLMLLDIDLALIPLARNFFNRCKSELKFTEYSAMKIPCVMTDYPPYSPVVEHGNTGLLYNSNEEMLDQLRYLIKDKEARKRIGGAANEWGREHRDIKKRIRDWADAFERCYEGERDRAEVVVVRGPEKNRPSEDTGLR